MARHPSTSYSRGPNRNASGPAQSLSISDLIPSYGRHLRAEGKTTATVDKTYVPALGRFNEFLLRMGMPTAVSAISREHVESYIVSLQKAGRKPATVSLAYRSVQPFWKWCVEEGEIKVSPMARMKAPAVPLDPPAVLRADEIQRLLRVCSGSDFEARRDLAIVSLLLDTGVRRGELAGLRVDSIDFDYDQVVIEGETSKSRRSRTVRFGKGTARTLDRYLRMRGRHPSARSPLLWLGKRGPMTGSGLLQVIERRGREAGVAGLHPHQFRHTFAHEMLSNGSQEGDLLQLGGWKDRGMLSRYGASAAAERARARYQSPLDRIRNS